MSEWRCIHGWLLGEQCHECQKVAALNKEIERLLRERDEARALLKHALPLVEAMSLYNEGFGGEPLTLVQLIREALAGGEK